MRTRRDLYGIPASVLLAVAVAACGTPVPTEPEVVEEEVTTPAGTVHTQVLVPAGAFRMGANDGAADEAPEHEVYLYAYYIDKCEVTNAQFQAFVEHAGVPEPFYTGDELCNRPAQPVVGVDFPSAYAYCEWAGMRLPTEAEWEMAAGGADSRIYPWGNEEPDASRVCYGGTIGRAADVGTKPGGASPYGAHDMAGNVWEWTLDFYQPDYYVRSPNVNPVNLLGGAVDPSSDESDHTIRGGGWESTAERLRITAREVLYRIPADQPDRHVGFRCVRLAE